MKVAQFGEDLIAAWKKAITGDLLVPCGTGEPGRKLAVHLRYRMYMLRKAMQKEAHPLAEPALRIKLKLTTTNGEHAIISAPADDEVASALRAAGVSVPKAPDLE